MKTKDFYQKGQILFLAIIVVGLVLVNSLVIIGGSQLFSQNTNYTTQVSQATDLAEAGVDKAIASLNATGGAYSGESETQLGTGSFSVNVTSPNAGTKIIESTGYIPSKVNPKVKRTINATISKGLGVAFVYGVQVGEGGLVMDNTSRVNGSIYSNGNIVMGNNAQITGDVSVAGGTAALADQTAECVGCVNFIFGKDIGGVLDVAQSFIPATSNYLNKIVLYLKRIGFPTDITVRIMADAGGHPDEDHVLASGTLTADVVSVQYSWVEIGFTASPNLSAGTTYWIVLDSSANSSNYWSWSADSLLAYNNGQAKWSPDWQDKHPVWNSPTAPPVDLDFKTYMGGLPTFIEGANGVTIGGEVHANTLRNLSIAKSAYYQTQENIIVNGSNCTSNPKCHPGSPDPPVKPMSVSAGNISAWQIAARDAGIYPGDITSCRSSLGPGKYVGNVTMSNGCTTTIYDPVWITGDLNLSNNVTFKLDSSYGSTSGVVLTDGQINLSNNVTLSGSGTTGSFLMLLSTMNSSLTGRDAVVVSNSGVQGILYAPYGIADIANNNHLTELTAWKIELAESVEITYSSGLASSFFSSGSGPSGSYSLVKGTYQLK